MTTTANKGGLRRVAEAKRNRHAQLTPLPDKIVEIDPTAYGDWTLAELRREARRRGLADLAILDKPGLQHALALADKVDAEAPKPKRVPRPVVQEASKEASSSNGEATGARTRSEAKAQAFGRDLVALGWSVDYLTEGELTEVVAKRGTEVIHQAWDGGVYHNSSATYTVGDRTVLTRNVSAARKLAARRPEEAEGELQRVASNRSFRKREPEAQPRVRRLPFDPETATEKEIVDSIVGKAVKWHNRLTNGEESAIVGDDPRRVRVEEQNGERVVLFCCKATGFRAFRIRALTAVGRGLPRTGRAKEGVKTVQVDVQ